MPRTRLQFKIMKDERMLSIYEAALPLFSLYGQKVSVDAISEKAKCSHGIVYHYFKNTAEIYEKLLKSSTYVELENSLLTVTEGSSYEKIEHIISILLDITIDDVEKASFLNIIIKNTAKTSLFSLLVKLIKDGQNAKSIVGGDPAELVNSIFVLLKGIYLSIIIEKHPTVKVPSLENVMQLIRRQVTF